MIQKALLTKRKQSRPGIIRRETFGIVMHYTASPGATAENIRDYFERTKRYASAHFVIGVNGKVLQIIPENEKAYHCGAWVYKPGIVDHFGPDPNMTSIGIEMCHNHHDGQLEKLTIYYAQLLVGYLCSRYELNPMTEVYTHHMITGKLCPRYWVEYPKEFEDFKMSLKTFLGGR